MSVFCVWFIYIVNLDNVKQISVGLILANASCCDLPTSKMLILSCGEQC